MARIFIIDGHPDPAPQRFVHALAEAYRRGAQRGQHDVVLVRVADLDVPLLRTRTDFMQADPPASVRPYLDQLESATHIVIVYPLWLGTMPALLKALLEQLIRPGFAFSTSTLGHWPVKYLKGKSARIIVTAGMSALSYRWRLRSGSSRTLGRGVLATSGIRHIRTTIIGNAERMNSTRRRLWLAKVQALGRRAQ